MKLEKQKMYKETIRNYVIAIFSGISLILLIMNFTGSNI